MDRVAEMEEIGLHTLDTEAYDDAVAAARQSLERSDLCTPERLAALADEEGAVADAAQQLLEAAGREAEASSSAGASVEGAPANPERVARLRFLMDERKTWPDSHFGDYDYEHLTDIVGIGDHGKRQIVADEGEQPNTGGAYCPRFAAISYDETYSFIQLFDTESEAAEHLAGTLGEETGGSIDGVVDLDTGVYYRATAKVRVELTHPQDRYVEITEEPT